eukprot:TRINITY_DN5727_c0_g1_i1.p1 TRINITY_DN5727_c0_g1~~TRINITY_DN5727_c0_g1_i1.p1  ORF type:complete len:128 (-),score=2.98 TRINITY_DN5727_c0_g1_i1:417-800(-)
MKEKSIPWVIVKPVAGSQGKGISIMQSNSDFIQRLGNAIVQQYIVNPLLINGLKFDLRIYVVVRSVFPLKIYWYRQGLARFCTEQYNQISKANSNNKFMHLSNYHINKRNPNYIQNENINMDGQGHK